MILGPPGSDQVVLRSGLQNRARHLLPATVPRFLVVSAGPPVTWQLRPPKRHYLNARWQPGRPPTGATDNALAVLDPGPHHGEPELGDALVSNWPQP